MTRLAILSALLLSLGCSGCRRLQGVCPGGVIDGSLAIHNGDVTTFNNLAWEEDWGPIENVALEKCRTVRGDLWITDAIRELHRLNSIEEVAGVITFLDVTGEPGALRDIFPALRTASGLRGAQAVGRFDVMSGFGSLVSIGFIQDDGFGVQGFEGFGRLETAQTIALGGTPFPRFDSLREVARLEVERAGGDQLVFPALTLADTILVQSCRAAAVRFPALGKAGRLKVEGGLDVAMLELPLLSACVDLEVSGPHNLSGLSAPLLTRIDGTFVLRGTALSQLGGLSMLSSVAGDATITDNLSLTFDVISDFLAHVEVGGATHVCRNQGQPITVQCEE